MQRGPFDTWRTSTFSPRCGHCFAVVRTAGWGSHVRDATLGYDLSQALPPGLLARNGPLCALWWEWRNHMESWETSNMETTRNDKTQQETQKTIEAMAGQGINSKDVQRLLECENGWFLNDFNIFRYGSTCFDMFQSSWQRGDTASPGVGATISALSSRDLTGLQASVGLSIPQL